MININWPIPANYTQPGPVSDILLFFKKKFTEDLSTSFGRLSGAARYFAYVEGFSLFFIFLGIMPLCAIISVVFSSTYKGELRRRYLFPWCLLCMGMRPNTK